jgi:vesicular inhibitory amino acid transporter
MSRGELSTDMIDRLPLAFYLKLFAHEIPAREKAFVWVVLLLSIILSSIGTVWAFLPKSWIT